LTYSHFDTPSLDALFLRRWKPALVLEQAAQIFDLTGVAGVAAAIHEQTSCRRIAIRNFAYGL
jgi:hypothetical protein